MAKNPTSRHGKPTRPPVTLDLEATEIKDAPTDDPHEAEPVAFEAGTAPEAATVTPDEPATETETQAPTEETAEASPEPAPPPASSGRGLSAIGGGVIGGLVALLIAGGLQWAGVLPSLRPAQTVDLTPLQGQIDALTQKVSSLESAPAPSADLGPVTADIDANKQTIAALEKRLADLSAAVSSGGAGEGAGVEALSQRVGDIETRLAALGDTVSGLQSAPAATDSAALDAMKADIASANQAASAAASELKQQIGAIDGRVSDLEAKVASGANNRVALALSASALKSAADRGSDFMPELDAYAAAGGEEKAVAALRDYAASGVPTQATLMDRFPAVANRIVATANGTAPDASIGERLMASARSLVQIRPVGEVEGDTPGAIAARMEVALKSGDLGGALSEWEKLPDSAREVSKDFAADLRARNELDTLIADMLAAAMAPAAPATNQ